MHHIQFQNNVRINSLFGLVVEKRCSKLVGSLLAGTLLVANLYASQWTLSQFSNLDPILTFETGTTALPIINGIHFTPYPYNGCDFSDSCIGSQMLGNNYIINGYNFIDISFDQPQQAIGGYVNNLRYGFFGSVDGVTEIVYDKSNNIIDSASVTVSEYNYSPVFLGIGENTTNIYHVEWQYFNPANFGVDNIIYQPGSQIVVSNVQASAGGISFSFQTLPGHTNIIQISTNLVIGNWTGLTNFSSLGMGQIMQVTIPATNLPAGYFRIQAQ